MTMPLPADEPLPPPVRKRISEHATQVITGYEQFAVDTGARPDEPLDSPAIPAVAREPQLRGTPACEARPNRTDNPALQAAMRTGFEAALRYFNPDALQARFDQQLKGKWRLRRPEYWEFFRAHYRSLETNPGSVYRELFGDESARAYEEEQQTIAPAREFPAKS
jgi:hypothetical protein